MSDDQTKKDKNSFLSNQRVVKQNGFDRRRFIFQTLQSSGQIVLASGVIYSLTLVTDKKGMSAGAK